VGARNKFASAEVIKKGIADDGGLFMPSEIVQTGYDIPGGYADIAAHILSLYLTDYEKSDIISMARRAYSETNFPDGAAKVARVTDKISALELYHGPTSAFKDMALQIMPLLLAKALDITDEKKKALILVATSGDTGKAALEGTKNMAGINTLVFYPKDGVSEIQKLQMNTQDGDNVDVAAVAGNFDDCQTGVKNIFADAEVRNKAEKNGIFFSSANSMNFGRLVPQVTYYFYGYAEMVKSGEIARGEVIDAAVPTGNFGNILAAYFAKKMGLPINKLICASNMNNILTDFFNTGIYDANRKFYTTMSPSMDILISSNLERLLYLAFGAAETAEYMRSLNKTGAFTAPQIFGGDFIGMYCDEENTQATIKRVFDSCNYLIDPHTAVAFHCAEQYGSNRKTLVVSTASAYKFIRDAYCSLTGIKENEELGLRSKLRDYTGVKIPKALDELGSKPIRFADTVEVNEMKDYVLKKLI